MHSRNETFLINLNIVSNKKIEELKNLNEILSLQNQVNQARSKDKLGKQNFHENIKKYSNHLLIQSIKPLNKKQYFD